MIRYMKLTFRGPENLENLYCTLTSVKIYGKGMHLVLRNSLLDLNDDNMQTESKSQNTPMDRTADLQIIK
jgi:hypothetical protein